MHWLWKVVHGFDIPAQFNFNNNSGTVVNTNGDNSVIVADGVDLVTAIDRKRPVDALAVPTEDFRGFLSHPVKIAHIDWTSVTAYSGISVDLVETWLTTIPTVLKEKLTSFAYFKADILLKVVVQGMPTAGGMGVLSATPSPNARLVGNLYGKIANANYVNSRIVPHLVLDPSKSESYELRLPVCTPEGFYYLDTTNGVETGSYVLEFFPYVPLLSGTATTPAAKICVYMSLINPMFEGLTVALGTEFEDEKKEGGTLSAVAKTASAVTEVAAKMVPTLAPYLTLFSKVSGVAGTVLAKFGYSKPPVVENTHFVLNRTADNYSQFDGRSTALVLGGSQAQSLALAPEFGLGKLQEMELAHICKIPGLVSRNVAITLAMASESDVLAWRVSPTACLTLSNPTPLAGCAIPFKYWRGDIIAKFEFVCSVFHRATVLVAWDPFATSITPPPFVKALTVLQNATVSISGNTTFDFRCAYKQYLPMLEVENYTTSVASGAREFTNGMIYLYVVNPVTTNGSTDGIKVNLHYYSDNIVFAGLDPYHIVHKRINTYALGTEIGGEEGPEVSGEPRDQLERLSLRIFGDMPRTIKEITSRMTRKAQASVQLVTSGANTRIWYFHLANAPFPDVTVRASATPATMNFPTFHNNFASHFGSAFLGYRGGVRYAFNTVAEDDPVANRSVLTRIFHTVGKWVYSPAGYTTVIPTEVDHPSQTYAFTNVNLKVSATGDVIGPQAIPLDFIPLRNVYQYYRDHVHFIAEFNQKATPVAGDDAKWFLSVETGSADDATFCWFLGFPAVTAW